MLPVTANAVSVPTLVMLFCAAVNSVPVMFVADKFATVALPVALTVPPVATLPNVPVPVALTIPAVVKLAPVTLPVPTLTLLPLEVIVAEPNLILLPDRYKSLQACVSLPKSYVTLVLGNKLPPSVMPAVVNTATLLVPPIVMLALPLAV